MTVDIFDAISLIRKNIHLASPEYAINNVLEYYNDHLHPTIVVHMFTDYLEDLSEKLKVSIGETALTFALAEYKKNVKEIPKGSNTSPEIRMYQEIKQNGYLYKQPWCGSFVTWCCLMATNELNRERFFEQSTGAAVINLYRWGHNNDMCHRAEDYIPQAGDIFLMLNDSCTQGIHTGFVYEFKGNHIITIEGNFNDRIARCKRPVTGAIKYYLSLK